MAKASHSQFEIGVQVEDVRHLGAMVQDLQYPSKGPGCIVGVGAVGSTLGNLHYLKTDASMNKSAELLCSILALQRD